MTSITKEVKQFFVDKLNVLWSLFPYSRYEVSFNHGAGVYFVKATPKELYNDEKFLEEKINIFSDFIDNRFDGMLSFINEDSGVKIENPDLIVGNYELLGFGVLHNLVKVQYKNPMSNSNTSYNLNNERAGSEESDANCQFYAMAA